MRIPLCYPKIPYLFASGHHFQKDIVVQEKIDGTNVHCYWEINDDAELDGKISSFGTRRDRYIMNLAGIAEFVSEHPNLKEVPELLLSLDLSTFGPLNWDKDVSLFFEFAGEKSFAGNHIENDPKKLYLLDAYVSNYGWYPPYQLIEDATKDGLNLPKLLYSVKYSPQIVNDIVEGKYGVSEGAVIKGFIGKEYCMAKVKTKDYLKRLEKYRLIK